MYHVHRVYLASGPRKSEYFQTLFSLQTETIESISRTKELVLPESACSDFPRFLDYIYEDTNEIGDGRGEVALAFLADYLGVPTLLRLSKRRIKNILENGNNVEHSIVRMVCCEALLYKIDWIIDECIRAMAESPHLLLPAKKRCHKPEYRRLMEMLSVEKQNELLELCLTTSLRQVSFQHYLNLVRPGLG